MIETQTNGVENNIATININNNNTLVDDQHEVSLVCSQSGGRAVVSTSLKQLLQQFDALANTLLRPVVVVRVAPLLLFATTSTTGNDYSLTPPAVSTQLLALPSPPSTTSAAASSSSASEQFLGNWPLPEDCIWTQGLTSLPSRSPHPLLRVRIVSEPIPTVDDIPRFPYDKYTLEASPLTEWMLAHRLDVPLLTGRLHSLSHTHTLSLSHSHSHSLVLCV
jgi:ATP-dependent RNA helicase DDX26B